MTSAAAATGPVEIRANTVLPARREPLRLRTSDGLSLVGELAVPEDRPAVGTLVCVHPLPTAGRDLRGWPRLRTSSIPRTRIPESEYSCFRSALPNGPMRIAAGASANRFASGI